MEHNVSVAFDMMHFDKTMDKFRYLQENVLDKIDVDEVSDNDEYEHDAGFGIIVRSTEGSLPDSVLTFVDSYLAGLVEMGIVQDGYKISLTSSKYRLNALFRMNLDENSLDTFCRLVIYICHCFAKYGPFEILVSHTDLEYTDKIVIDKQHTINNGQVIYKNIDKIANFFHRKNSDVIRSLFVNSYKSGFANCVDDEDGLYVLFLEDNDICIVGKDGDIRFKLRGCEHNRNKNMMYHCGLLMVNHEQGVYYVDKRGYRIPDCDVYSGENFVNGLAKVKYQDEKPKNYALIDKSGKPISKCRFTKVGPLEDEFIVVTSLDDRMNYIKHNGEMLVKNMWFSSCEHFSNGYGVVVGINGCNLVDRNGNMVFNNSGRDKYEMQENGLVLVKKDILHCNFMDLKTKKFILDEFCSCEKGFSNGYAVVSFDNRSLWNYVDASGNFLFSKHREYCDCKSFDSNGNAVVCSYSAWSGNVFNVIDKSGRLLSDTWFNCIYDFYEGFSKVFLEDKGYNFIDRSGKFVSDIWFDEASRFNNGFAFVVIDGNGNMIDRTGKLLVDKDSNIYITRDTFFSDGCAEVENTDKKWNVLREDGTLVFDEWVDKIVDFAENLFYVCKKTGGNGRHTEKMLVNIINIRGEVLFDPWLDGKFRVDDTISKNFVIMNDKNECNIVSSKTGSLVLKEWTRLPISDNGDGTYRVGSYSNVDEYGEIVSFV